MSGRERARREGHRRLALAVLSLGLAAAITLIAATRGSGAPGSEPAPLPLLGVADSETTLMGATPGGEAWAYRQLPLAVGSVATGSGPLAFGPPPDPSSPTKQLALLRYTASSGWQVFQTPVDSNGNPYRGPVPNRLSPRITPSGGGVLVGRDPNRPASEQAVVLDHEPGGSWRALPAPDATVLHPAEGEAPAEELAAERGDGAIADAAFDEAGRTGLFFAPKGRSVEDAVIHWDGEKWLREPVKVPIGSEEKFHILAIAATGAANAWAIAEAASTLGHSFVLLERASGGPAEWVERGIGAAEFADRDSPSEGIEGLAPIPGAAQPLTVTQDGVWVDLSGTIEGAQRDVTIFYDIGSGAVTGAWCDAALCEKAPLGRGPLGVKLSRQLGYRSFAWPGGEFGSRIVTNPLDPGGSEESNRGTYLRFAGGEFVRMPGGSGDFRPSGAFSGVDEGWLQGPVEISGKAPPSQLRPWPIPLRAPLTAITGAPGAPPGSLGSGALAVGDDGAVARYVPGQGWQREYLTTSSGAVKKVTLRGVAWPEPTHAWAVGDRGAMWEWNADDDLWIADPGVPIGFEGNLMGIAFDPADPARGYAVGKSGVLLGYGKSWEQEALPAGFASASLTSIAFAGSEAIVAAGSDLLVNEGGGWHVDASAHALLNSTPGGNAQLYAVAGLPDGGAVAAGRDIVIERDSAGAPWRFAAQPILGSTAIAAAAVRAGGSVRAVVSAVPQISFPPADDLPPPDPNVPPPIIPPFGLPGDGYLLRETASGWEDEERTAFAGAGFDRPVKTDPTLALLLEPSGEGWAVGGWSGNIDAAGRGVSGSGGGGSAVRSRVRTAAISRFGSSPAAAPNGATPQGVSMPAGPVRFAVAGNAQCEEACADLAPESLGPDRTLSAALALVARMRGGWGPRGLLYTGNRVATGLGAADGARYASLLASQGGLPVFPALGSSDLGDGSGAGVFETSLAGFPAPLGSGAAPAGISTAGIPGAAADPGRARTHYAFDSSGPGGTVRVIVIDNSAGSLAASDPHQNPLEAQLPWLEAVLADARNKGIATVVMGNRGLNTSFTPKLNVASDGNEVARALIDGGASVYLFDRPEENRAMRIPAGGTTTIPSFGTGTLGYRSQLSGVIGTESPDSLFGDAGTMVLELEAAQRDPATNRAPVSVRLIPVIQDLSLEAIDGTLLRRSIPALFSGLGRRPLGGDRWGTASGSGVPNPAGGDPYTEFPPDQCLVAGCSSRVSPEYSFTSTDPDIADFVKQDPNSANLRKPFLDSKGKVVTDNSSALLCPFNAGTTTVTVSAGGHSYSQPLTVQAGSVQRPCGTRPLNPDRFKRNAATATPPPPPPPPPPAPSPAPASFPPPAPPPAVNPPAPPPNPVHIVSPPVIPAAFVPVTAGLLGIPAAAVLPPPPPIVRPLPPGGAPARTYQVEEKREEEAATEESQAFSRYEPGDGGSSVPPYLPALIVLLALGGASVRGGPGARRRARPAPATGQAGPRRR